MRSSRIADEWDDQSQSDKQPQTEPNARDVGRVSRSELATELHFRQLFAIVRRRRLMIAAIAICGTLLATAIATLIPPKYTAKAQIVVEPQPTSLIDNAQDANLPPVDQMAVDTQVTMLSARDYLRRVVAKLAEDGRLGAAATPSLTKSGLATSKPETEHETETGAFAKLKRQLLDWIDALKNRPQKPMTIDEFAKNLKINQELTSRIIAIRYISKDPEEAAAVVNRIVRFYLENQSERKKAYLRDELARLNERIASLDRVMIETQSQIQQQLERLAGIGETTGSKQDAEAALRKLKKASSVNVQLMSNLMRRQKEIRNRQEKTSAGARILSLAYPPERPSSLNPFYFILPGAFLSFACGGFLAIALDHLDQRLRSEYDINNALGIPCIGLVPKLSEIDSATPHEYLRKEPTTPHAVAIRSIVASLQLTAGNNVPKVVLLSSSEPGEGKTTLAVNLAVCAASLPQRQRVLLVDLDFRNPAKLRSLNQNAEHGVVDLVLKKQSLQEVVQYIPELKLHYLPMPNCSVDPLTLFANNKLKSTLDSLSMGYDFVVIDGPPLLGVPEAGLLTSMVDKVLFVVKWGSTRRDVARNALKTLDNFGSLRQSIVDRTSAIVTQVPLDKHARYQLGDTAEMFVKHKSASLRAAEIQSMADPAELKIESRKKNGEYRLQVYSSPSSQT